MIASPWRLGLTVALFAVTFAAAAGAAVALSRTSGGTSGRYSAEPIRAQTHATDEVSELTVVIGDSAASIGRRLVVNGVIDSHDRFRLLALLLGWESRLEPGSYTFEPGLTTFEILRRIHVGETSPWRVVFPEGLRLEQVAEHLAESRLARPSVVAAAQAMIGAPPDDLVRDTLAAQRPDGASLEGYLFPSAYTFPLDGTAEDAVRAMLERFDEEIGSITPPLEEQISDSGRTLHEILVIASIIEREVIEDSERALVSAVIWNRLEDGMPLQMDSTVQYAVGRPSEWWKRNLDGDDLAAQSPYNTYVVTGLPPTPIASPGLASIAAAADPARVPYLYFVARGDGTHAFAVTYEEHQANIERYLNGGEGGP